MSTKTPIFLCDYRYDNSTYGIDFPAFSFTDAAERLKAVVSNGQVLQIVGNFNKIGYATYLCGYEFQNSDWNFEILATSLADAECRLKKIGEVGEILGKLYYEFESLDDFNRIDADRAFLENSI